MTLWVRLGVTPLTRNHSICDAFRQQSTFATLKLTFTTQDVTRSGNIRERFLIGMLDFYFDICDLLVL